MNNLNIKDLANGNKPSKITQLLRTSTMAEIMQLASGNKTIGPIRNAEQLKDYINAGGYGKYTEKYKDLLICNPMSSEWKQNIAENKWWASTNRDKDTEDIKPLREFMDTLLGFGGEEVCMELEDEHFYLMKDYGQFWLGKNIKMMKGIKCACHQNSADLWNHNKTNTLICTGYALSEDGMWRQHSWVLWFKPRSVQIVETTTPRKAYYGVCLDYNECYIFKEMVTF